MFQAPASISLEDSNLNIQTLVSGRFLESYSRQVESLRKDKDGQRHASNGLVASSKASEDVGRAT